MAKKDPTYPHQPIDDAFLNSVMDGDLSDVDNPENIQIDTEDESMLADAVEGLSLYESMDIARAQTAELNQKLTEQLKTKKDYKKEALIHPSLVIWISIILVLALAILAFFLIKSNAI